MPISLLGILALAVASSAFANEPSTPVTLGGREVGGVYQVARAPLPDAILFEIGPSDILAEPFDSVVIQGVLPSGGVAFEFSRLEPSGRWSPWIRATMRRERGGRFWAKVRFSGPAPGAVWMRAVDAGGSTGQDVVLYEMSVFLAVAEAVHAGGTPADEVQVSTFPGLILREQWGARPPRNPRIPHVPVRFTQHHTAGGQSFSLDESIKEMRFIQELHQDGRGFDDIGYHFLIDSVGNVFQGRPVGAMGAHVRGHNDGNIGISLLGYYHPPFDHSVSTSQLVALRSLGRWIRDELGIDPATYAGHRDLGATSCPGDIVYALLDTIRDSFRDPDKRSFPAAVQPAALRPLRGKAPPAGALFDGHPG